MLLSILSFKNFEDFGDSFTNLALAFQMLVFPHDAI